MQQLLGDELRVQEMRYAARRYVEEEHDLQKYCERVVAEYESLLSGTHR